MRFSPKIDEQVELSRSYPATAERVSDEVRERDAGFAIKHYADNPVAVVGEEHRRGVWAGSGNFFGQRLGGGQFSQCVYPIRDAGGFRPHRSQVKASASPRIACDSGTGGGERVFDELSGRITNERHNAFTLWHMMRASEQGGELQFRGQHRTRVAQRS